MLRATAKASWVPVPSPTWLRGALRTRNRYVGKAFPVHFLANSRTRSARGPCFAFHELKIDVILRGSHMTAGFEWDQRKATENERKDYEEGVTA